MDNKKQNWGSVRSKLTQEGYMYRMKLGNTTPSSNSYTNRLSNSSSTSAGSAQRPLSTEHRADILGPKDGTGIHKTRENVSAISRLLHKLDLDQVLNNRSELGSAIDFLSECYEPFVIHRCHKTINFELGNFLDPSMLEDKMLAQAALVWLSDMRNTFGPEPRNAGEMLLSQRSSVLKDLRKRISSLEACTSEPVMWTVLSLVATELIHDNMQALGTHLGALRHIIDLRGGIDSPAVSKWVKILLLQFERYLNHRQFHDVRRASIGRLSPVLECSYFSFPGNARDTFPRIPLGFAELFRSIHVTTRTLNLVESINEWTEQIAEGAQMGTEREAFKVATSAMTLDSFRAFDLLQGGKLDQTEHLLVLGLFSYCVYMNDEVVYSVMEWILRLHSLALLHKHVEPVEEQVRDSMLWVAATLMATEGRGSPLCRLGKRIYIACRGRHLSVRALSQTAQKHFWHVNLAAGLAEAAGDRAE